MKKGTCKRIKNSPVKGMCVCRLKGGKVRFRKCNKAKRR